MQKMRAARKNFRAARIRKSHKLKEKTAPFRL